MGSTESLVVKGVMTENYLVNLNHFVTITMLTVLPHSETAEAVISGLKPFKLYEFDVKAHTDTASGAYSPVIQCSTLEGR